VKSFPDEVEITVRGGAGGPGCVSFQRAAFKPRGRPDGGDGGSGGDVVLEASQTLRTLSHFRPRRLFQAPNGKPGQGADRHGKSGPPLTVSVPLGTRVYDAASGELLGDLLTAGERLVLARGGRGGKGNAHFTSSRMRSPRFAQSGEKGGERRIRLELHILADIGLIGQPNAGKSTLLTALTASKARVAAFPFTTLSPQLGALFEEDEEPLILAEVPGLIPGAHRGKGLGHRFLRHLKRTRLLVHVIDLSRVEPRDPLAPLKELEAEMAAFDPALLARPRFIVLNKTDLIAPDFPKEDIIKKYREAGWQVLAVSALTGEGLEDLRRAIRREAAKVNYEVPATETSA
jgi:GTP-binding protein